MFTDQVHITVQAGRGGNGCDSYNHRPDRKVVPHGADGGDGGSVILRAEGNAPSLSTFRFRQKLTAEDGGHGGSEKKRGRNGKDLILIVPAGTEIVDRERQLLIRHLEKEGEEVVVVKGGKGGGGNQGGKPSTWGEKGEILELELRLRIPADAFFVGLPNSGKSKLLNALSRAHAKEEAYPFTTQVPEMGVCALSEYESLMLCELPSIYESSHEGRGMGSHFLKHLQGAKFIFYVIDPVSEFCDSLTEGFKILQKQLEVFDEGLLKIPYAVIVTKMDLPEAKTRIGKKKFDPGAQVFYISALSGNGIKELKKFFAKNLLPA